MMIPKDKIEEVRARASIVAVVSDYMPLKKRGAGYLGLCPFHSEKTPSFSVSEEKKIFYCFGCNTAGNAITFVMKKENLSFPDAVRSLARRFGVVIKEEKSGASDLKASICGVNGFAREYFRMELASPANKRALDYLAKRGYSDPALLERFSVGFAPDKWDGLIGFLRKKGVSMDLAEKAGLVVKKDGGGHYDRFRARVMFPVTDVLGRIIAFGGRTIDNKEPKYLNSPETAVFKKGETFYGLHQAMKAISKQGSAIVVEGYFDLIALHRHGFSNSVATMGTALTTEHLKFLKPYAEVVYSLFDSDDAGRNAALRGLGLFLEAGVSSKIVLLPSGKDPDEFLSKSGGDALKAAIDKAEPLMEFYLKDMGKRLNTKTPEGKTKYLDEAARRISRFANPAEKGHYAAMVASTLGIAPDAVYDAVRTFSPKGAEARPLKDVIALKGSSLKEVTILKVILGHPELLTDEVARAVEMFEDADIKKAGRFIVERLKSGAPAGLSELVDELGDEKAVSKLASRLFRDEDGFIENPEKMLEDCLKKVLNSGKLKPETEDMLKRHEEAGKDDFAPKIRERAEAKKRG